MVLEHEHTVRFNDCLSVRLLICFTIFFYSRKLYVKIN